MDKTIVRMEYGGVVVEGVNLYGGAPLPDVYRVTFDGLNEEGLEFTPREYDRLVEVLRAARLAPPA